MKATKLTAWRPYKTLKIAGPALMVLAFGWIGVRLLTDSNAATIPGGAVQLYVSPSSSNVTQGEQFSVNVKVNTNGQTINAVRSDLTYPSDQLELVSTTNVCLDPFGITAENLPGSGTPTPGSVKIACGSINGVTGDYAVATLTFKALANTGTAAIAFANTSEALLKSNNSNQLGSTVSGTVTMSAQAPTITTISPASGSSLGGTTVTISGSNFVSAPTVKFGNSSATSVMLNSATSITAVAPANAPGAVTVSVTVAGQTAIKAGGFTYIDTTAPGKPGTPTVSANDSAKVTIGWSAATDTGGTGIAGYRVYRNGTLITSSLVAITSYADSTVQPNTTYTYTVAAVDGAGNAGAQTTAVSVTTRFNGDLDANGTVNLTDLSILLSSWGKTGSLSADINRDNVVNLTDLSMLLSNWGKS